MHGAREVAFHEVRARGRALVGNRRPLLLMGHDAADPELAHELPHSI